MKIKGIIWLPIVIDKLLRKHALTQEEVEQVFVNGPQYRFLERGKIVGEDVYAAYGRTDAGRYVTVIFILKSGKALVITARNMDRKERRQYGK